MGTSKGRNKKAAEISGLVAKDGAPGRIRTSDPQVRSLVLYPAELRAREARNYDRRVRCRQCIHRIYSIVMTLVPRCGKTTRNERFFQPIPCIDARNRAEHISLARLLQEMAESEGFEPSMELLTPYSLSRGAPSASRATLRSPGRHVVGATRAVKDNGSARTRQTQFSSASPSMPSAPSPRRMRW